MQTLRVSHQQQMTPLMATVSACVQAAVAQTDLTPDSGIYAIRGMSGLKYRYFINRLIGQIDDARYLEVGSWMGSTLCAAIHGNRVTATAIDNWSQYGGPKDAFLENVRTFRTPEAEVTFLEADFRAVDYAGMKPHNVYLFDGPHDKQDQHDGLAMALPCLDPEFVFIVDDWNWKQVRLGTANAIRACGLEVRYLAEIRSTMDETQPEARGQYSDWHNGYFISVLAKPGRGA